MYTHTHNCINQISKHIIGTNTFIYMLALYIVIILMHIHDLAYASTTQSVHLPYTVAHCTVYTHMNTWLNSSVFMLNEQSALIIFSKQMFR